MVNKREATTLNISKALEPDHSTTESTSALAQHITELARTTNKENTNG